MKALMHCALTASPCVVNAGTGYILWLSIDACLPGISVGVNDQA